MKQIRLARAGLHIFWLLALKRSKALEKFERLRIVLHDILLSTVASALVIGPYCTGPATDSGTSEMWPAWGATWYESKLELGPKLDIPLYHSEMANICKVLGLTKTGLQGFGVLVLLVPFSLNDSTVLWLYGFRLR